MNTAAIPQTPDAAFIRERDEIQHFIVDALAFERSPHLVFKGGTMLRVCVFDDYRFSEDLDFDWTGSPDRFDELMRRAGNRASKKSGHNIYFAVGSRSSRSSFKWKTEAYEGSVKIDRLLCHKNLLPGTQMWRVIDHWNNLRTPMNTICGYRLESVLSDKLRALASLRRAKARDLYDIRNLFSSDRVSIDEAFRAYESTPLDPRSKGTQSVRPEELPKIFFNKYQDLKDDWKRLEDSKLADPLPDFESTFTHFFELFSAKYPLTPR